MGCTSFGLLSFCLTAFCLLAMFRQLVSFVYSASCDLLVVNRQVTSCKLGIVYFVLQVILNI
jgi:hypothetical protein